MIHHTISNILIIVIGFVISSISLYAIIKKKSRDKSIIFLACAGVPIAIWALLVQLGVVTWNIISL